MDAGSRSMSSARSEVASSEETWQEGEATPAEHTIKSFSLLGLPVRCALDPEVLERHFRERQLRLHPDLPQNKGREIQAQKAFSVLVAAYEALKALKTRAKILFQHKGVWPIPQTPETLEKLLTWEEERQEGTLDDETLQLKIDQTACDLIVCLDANDLSRAGRAYMFLNGLRRLQDLTD